MSGRIPCGTKTESNRLWVAKITNDPTAQRYAGQVQIGVEMDDFLGGVEFVVTSVYDGDV
jgi:hypothetical protein